MFQNKSIVILRTFTSQEVRQFDEYLRSPFFNKNQTIIQAFDIIKAWFPLFEHPNLERTLLYKLIFNNEQFDEQKLRYLMTDLTKHLEEYLCYKAISEEQIFKYHLLLYTYRLRRLDKAFLNTLKLAEKALNDQPRRDVSHAFYQYLIEEDRYRFMSDRREHLHETNLQQVVDNLDKYYILNKMRYSAEIINNKNVVAINYKLFLYDEIMNHIRHNPLDYVPSAKIYYNIILTLTEPENKIHYTNLLDLLKEHHQLFSKEEIFEMYVYAKNYCIRKINHGDVEYIRELFDLYKVMLKDRIIFKENYLSQFDYKNIVYLGLRISEFDWVKNFISKYNEHLDPAIRQNAYTFNMAYYHFFQNNYDEVLTLLRSVEFTDFYYHLDSKSLLLKTYFELEETEALFSLIEAFKVYIKRNNLIPAYQKTGYINMIKLSSKLYKWKLNPKNNIQDIVDEFNNTKPVVDVLWMRKKLETLQSLSEKLTGNWRK
ncbi:MAG: hypothetical protein WBP31_03920 [Chitinophagales bacterium]|jgi:hypothetical protein|nr:hypothetical protein [Bacteroidota bacterium]MBK9554395.1 hypothetical protein [Bacteroidota bacterium]MBL0279997.1 hypothetical protein [Bacteroidota bacterium]MBP9879076.1 hypothetical protein [Chitinophagales bacterium]